MFKSIRKFALLLMVMVGCQSAHAGIPVIDGANLVQAVQQTMSWIEQFDQMVQQIQQLSDQIEQTKTMTGKLDVARLLGSILNDPNIRFVLPDEMKNYQVLGNGGAYGGSRLTSINTLLAGYGVKTAIGGTPVTMGQTSADALLKMQAVLRSAQSRTAQVNSLAARVDSAEDAKASMDLVNRNVIESTRVSMDMQQTLATIEANRQAEHLRQIALDQQGMEDLKAKAAATRAALGI